VWGYQDFSHQISFRYRLGNPWYADRGDKITYFEKRPDFPMAHKGGGNIKVYTYQSLKEIFELYGFKVERIAGAGYPPFTRKLASTLSSLDPRHAHYLIAKVRKPLQTIMSKI
jgi:hypothetical protein